MRKWYIKKILRARAIPTDALLEKVNNQERQNKITFIITYHPVFRDVRFLCLVSKLTKT